MLRKAARKYTDHIKPSMCTFVSQDNLQYDLRQDNGYCSYDSSLDVLKSYTEVTGMMSKQWLSMPGKGSSLKTRAIQTLTQENRRERLWSCLIVHAENTKTTPSASSFQTPKKQLNLKSLIYRVTFTTRHLQCVVRGNTKYWRIVRPPGHDEDIAESKHDRYNIF